MSMKLEGMLGLGDNLHQRAIVREALKAGPVWLSTPWPCVYHDLMSEGLNLVPRASELRTQTRNLERERAQYTAPKMPAGALRRIWYTHQGVRRHGGFAKAMAAPFDIAEPDFSWPVADAWRAAARRWLGPLDRPLLIYRPLVTRTEWDGCSARNPDGAAYVALFESIRHRFHVVSVADLRPGVEWVTSPPVIADREAHDGELDIQTIAGLVSLAALVWAAPGMMLVMAQAIGTALVGVFGGHESARLYSHGQPQQLFIEPGSPCECFSKSHACDKTIDLPAAEARLHAFIAHHCP